MDQRKTRLSNFWRFNSLSLVVVAIFMASWIAQLLAGHAAWNDDRALADALPIGLIEYALSGHFVGATFENWESEFLQMGMYVLLTVWFRQKGSAESRPMDPSEENPRIDPGAIPTPVLRGGIIAWLYSHSLSLAFFSLFSASFALHGFGSWRHELDLRVLHGRAPIGLWEHLCGSQFWFESLQNWQSEFLAVFSIVVFTIHLRERDSPQSKPVRAPHAQTGD